MEERTHRQSHGNIIEMTNTPNITFRYCWAKILIGPFFKEGGPGTWIVNSIKILYPYILKAENMLQNVTI